MRRLGPVLAWAALATVVTVPLALATASPYLQYRQPLYVVAGFAGVLALGVILVQPLLAAGYLPGLPMRPGRQVHWRVGAVLTGLVVLHVAGLWITNPADAWDALRLASPTPFSVWGVAAMWAVFAAALLAGLRRRLRIRPRIWRPAHTALAAVIVVGTVIHALLIEGTMEPWSKAVLSLAAVSAFGVAATKLRAWTGLGRRR